MRVDRINESELLPTTPSSTSPISLDPSLNSLESV